MAVNSDAILFLPDGRPAYPLLAFWRARAPTLPLQATVTLLEVNLTANDQFRGIWQASFPDRLALPPEPLADRDGRGTEAFWNIFS